MQHQNHDFSSAAHNKPKSKKNSSSQDNNYAKIGKKAAAAPKSKIGGRVGEGEIIPVPGGHIIRATGGKDRHSKVYTSKGPRDRRVRLSANTAIQFYDVQDRLGYDRPSKAVDWLMNKAKEAIDKLEANRDLAAVVIHQDVKMDHSPNDFNLGSNSNSNSVQEIDLEHQQESANIRYAFQLQRHLSGDLNTSSGIMATLPGGATGSGTQSMADSMKSFFPLNPGTSLMEMQSYPHSNNNNRLGIQSEDLGLLLQSHNQNQRGHQSHTEMLLHHHQQHHQGSNSYDQTYNTKEAPETSWNNNNNLGGHVQEENRVGFIFNNPNGGFSSQNSSEHHHQREPLQSNNYTQLLHSWNERMLPSVDHHQQHHHHNVVPQQPTLLQPCSYNLYFGSNFQIPTQIHGEPEQEDEEEDEEEDHSH